MTTLGAQYFRPPNPPRADWRTDLERMRDAGMNTVKLWACWSWMNPAPGEYDFDELDELIAIAREVGLTIVINTIVENAPYWLEQAHPEARYVDQDGRPVQLTAAMNTPGGGWPGLCFDNPAVWEAAERFLGALVDRYGDDVAVWDVWNEPHLEPASYYPERQFCYCDASLARFGDWLQTKYASLDELNGAWARRYSDWAQVSAPRVFETVPDLIDWRESWFAALRHWLDRRVEAVRSRREEAVVMTHVALSGFTGQLATHTLDEFTLTGGVDRFGTSSFPTWLMGDDHVEHLFNLDTARDAAAGVPFWQAELQGGRGRRDGKRTTGQPGDDVVDLWMWNAIAAGATGVMFWQWRPELLGPESPGYGLTAPDGTPTSRVERVADFARVAGLPELQGRSTETPRVGLLVSRGSALHAYATDRSMDLYRDAVLGAYRMLVDQDIAVTIVSAERAEAEGLPSGLEAIYWPMPSVASDALGELLTEFVEQGGTLVSEATPGEYTELGFRRPNVPAARLRAVFGAEEVESTTAEEGTRVQLAADSIGCHWLRSPIRPEGGRVEAVFDDGEPAVVTHVYGQGRAVLIGTFPSLGADARSGRAVARLLAASEPPTPWTTPRPGLVTRRATAADGAELRFAINWTREPAGLVLAPGEEIVATSRVDALSADQDPALSARSAVLLRRVG
ncbi:beta-galactosidase GanA [Leifsonia sp. EB41]|uniref:beta-galactosidase n=1 Tax=Leifsonia sp. EB41 TaxID=3156260 RepID=UPI0035129525